jgi:hypothetical protein
MQSIIAGAHHDGLSIHWVLVDAVGHCCDDPATSSAGQLQARHATFYAIIRSLAMLGAARCVTGVPRTRAVTIACGQQSIAVLDQLPSLYDELIILFGIIIEVGQ